MSKYKSAFQKINLVRSFNDGKMTNTQKSILFFLATHLGDNDFVFVSLVTLAKECCLEKPNVVNNIKALINFGYLSKIKPSDGYKSNRYVIEIEKIASIAANTDTGGVVSEQYCRGNGALPEGYRSDTGGVTEQYPNRKIKEKEKKNKRKRPLRVVSQPSFKSEEQEYKLCTKCSRPQKHCSCVVISDKSVARSYLKDIIGSLKGSMINGSGK